MGSSGVAHPEVYLGQAYGSRPRKQAFPDKSDILVWGLQLGRVLRGMVVFIMVF